ncbi:hypothetical protein FB451DRAFT_1190359 [Mycena latifolia]|nr:hypothetical protein FB451DRAFT_1190359 [Mycena latifolia]
MPCAEIISEPSKFYDTQQFRFPITLKDPQSLNTVETLMLGQFFNSADNSAPSHFLKRESVPTSTCPSQSMSPPKSSSFTVMPLRSPSPVLPAHSPTPPPPPASYSRQTKDSDKPRKRSRFQYLMSGFRDIPNEWEEGQNSGKKKTCRRAPVTVLASSSSAMRRSSRRTAADDTSGASTSAGPAGKKSKKPRFKGYIFVMRWQTFTIEVLADIIVKAKPSELIIQVSDRLQER